MVERFPDRISAFIAEKEAIRTEHPECNVVRHHKKLDENKGKKRIINWIGNYKHGHANSKGTSSTYNSWASMIQRCTNLNCPAYPNWGGKGITVYEPWMKFENFLADMGEKPPGTEIDRIDPRGNYEPGNVEWNTHEEGSSHRTSNVFLTFRGEKKTVAQWARKLGMAMRTLWARLDYGWTVEEAFTTPIRQSVWITCFGKTMLAKDWAAETGLTKNTISGRIKQGWPVEKALTEPPRKSKWGQCLNGMPKP